MHCKKKIPTQRSLSKINAAQGGDPYVDLIHAGRVNAGVHRPLLSALKGGEYVRGFKRGAAMKKHSALPASIAALAIIVGAFVATTNKACADIYSVPGTFALQDLYTLQFYKIDDLMTGYITNSAYSQKQISQVGFSPSGPVVDISSYIRSGENDILITDCNGPSRLCSGNSGYTWGYAFQINGVTYNSADCGIWNVYGCDNNSYQAGIVLTHDVVFDVAPSQIPIPPTWTMMLIGLGGLGFLTYRRQGIG